MEPDQLRRMLGGPAPEVAPLLLGAVLEHAGVSIRLTEVEAYGGADDPASHAWRGRTTRNASMYGSSGRCYLYRSHGLHWCANVVCGTSGVAAAVLLRAGAVVDGHRLAADRRRTDDPDRWARGPGCLAQALALGPEHDGVDLLCPAPGGPRLSLGSPGTGVGAGPIGTGPRVGVSRAADVPWRFVVPGEPTVSAYRRSPRAPDRATPGAMMDQVRGHPRTPARSAGDAGTLSPTGDDPR